MVAQGEGDSVITFTLDGTTSAALGLATLDVKRPMHAPRANRLLTLGGRAGAYYESWTLQPLEVAIDIAMVGTSEADIQDKVRDLAAVLCSIDSPVALVFSDEPDKCLYVIPSDGGVDVERLATARIGQLKFIAPDPFYYATEETTLDLTDSVTFPDFNLVPNVGADEAAGGGITIVNNGTAPTHPRFILPFATDSGYLKITRVSEGTDGAYVLLGEVEDVELAPNADVKVIDSRCSSTTGWTASSMAAHSGNGGWWYASGLGSGGAWHGATITKAFSEDADDFAAAAYFFFDNTPSSKKRKCYGRMFVQYLAENGTVIAEQGIVDASGSSKAYVYAKVLDGIGGTRSVYSTYGTKKKRVKRHGKWVTDTKYSFNNFDGKFIVRRTGNKWWFDVVNVHGRTMMPKAWRKLQSTFPTAGGFVGNDTLIHSVKFFVQQYGTKSMVPSAHIRDIICWHKKDPDPATERKVEILAGDIIEVDMAQAVVYRNGDPWMEALALGSEFFDIDVGSNEILIAVDTNPAGSFGTGEFKDGTTATAAVTFTERFF